MRKMMDGGRIKMKIKRYILIIIILLILVNMASISAIENNNDGLEISNENPIEISNHIQNNYENSEKILSKDSKINQTNHELLLEDDNYQNEILTKSFSNENKVQMQNNRGNDKLSNFLIDGTKIIISVNDTQKLETTGKHNNKYAILIHSIGTY